MIWPATVLARCLWSLHSVDEFAVPYFENALKRDGKTRHVIRPFGPADRIAAANRGWHPGRQYRVGLCPPIARQSAATSTFSISASAGVKPGSPAWLVSVPRALQQRIAGQLVQQVFPPDRILRPQARPGAQLFRR